MNRPSINIGSLNDVKPTTDFQIELSKVVLLKNNYQDS
jgi:hypothetical protein